MEQEILAGLMARGMSLPVAQAAVANMIAESNLNPSINEIAPTVPGSRGGLGLNQWTGPRRRQLEDFASSRGSSPNDLNTQLDFTMWEMQNTERGAWDALQGATDPIEAARIYSEKFLRPGIPHLDRRLSEAARIAGMDYTPQGGSNALATGPQMASAGPNALAAPTLQDFGFQNYQLDARAFQRPTNALARG